MRNYSTQSIRQNIVEQAQQEITYCSDRLEKQIRSVTDNVYSLCNLALNSPLCEVESPYVTAANTIRVMEFQQEMINRFDLSGDAYRYFCYFESSGTIVGTRHTFLRPEDFFRDYLQVGEEEGEAWFAEWTQSSGVYYPAEEMWEFGSGSGRYMVFSQRFPTLSKSKGSVIALFSPHIITPYIDMLAQYGGGIEIRDRAGTLLYAYPPELTVEDASGGAAHTMHSDVLGWTIAGILPHAYLSDALREFDQYLWSLLVVSMVLCVILSILMGYRTLRTMRVIDQAVANSFGMHFSGNLSEAREIARSINTIAEEQSALTDKYRQNDEIIENYLLLHFLRGTQTYNADETTTLQLGFSNTSTKLILWVRMNTRNGAKIGDGSHLILDIKKDLRTLLSSLYDQVAICDINMQECVVLIGAEVGDGRLTDQLDELFHALSDRIRMPGDIEMKVAASDEFISAQHVSVYYYQAQEAMGYHGSGKSGILLTYQNLSAGSNRYYYPPETVSKIIAHIKTGNYDSLTAILDRVLSENEKRGLSPRCERMLLDEMRLTLVKLIGFHELSDAEYIEQLSHRIDAVQYTDLGQTFEKYAQLMRGLCNVVRMERTTTGTERAVSPAIVYVESHFRESTLSIAQVAEAVRLSVPYLSRVFKETTGETFSAYLEKLRMEHACALLKQGETIENTARLSGYNSPNTFRNSFKRRTGMLPNEYRRGHGEDATNSDEI